MTRDTWMIAEEEVREEMCEECNCVDEDLDPVELDRRVEVRYQSKIEELYGGKRGKRK